MISQYHIYLKVFSSPNRTGFFNLSTTDCHLGPGNYIARSCPVHCRMLSSTLGLLPLDAGSAIPLVVIISNLSRHCQVFSGGQNLPRWRTTAIGKVVREVSQTKVHRRIINISNSNEAEL